MLFAAVIAYAHPDRVPAARPAHREYLAGLLAAGRVAVAGPLADPPGALIVYDAADAAEVEALIRADPYHAAGVFGAWQVRPWTCVFAAPGLLAPPG